MNPMYTGTATATGGREGQVKSSDGFLEFSLVKPKGMGGKGEEGTNPEQLFAAGYSACFGSALELVIQQKKADVQESSVTANVSIGKDEEDGGFKLAVELDVNLRGVDQETAQELAEAAHQVCPYSKATRGNIDVTIKAKGE
ncbi:organic hydroperoxide resistance protein [Metabacillus sp. GX 13764]|uniref:organic hydroperoxide resistance protein n=1 Tax=Metabacillus kandeliae TaxID=2900151 RepID=UPI001E2B2008|nr:organic hydroperoxide resistance protein [Metabacillus kandeliae]MCD7036083.1 organic hydroperoxide resistance protein [Metabacillus kandeliae]